MKQKNFLFGLTGFPLDHSWSATYFNDKFKREGITNSIYKLFPLKSIDEFPALLQNEPQLTGLNVTIPYKEKIIPYLDELDVTAKQIGAVNTVKIRRKDGVVTTKGFNTDAGAFYLTVKDQIKAFNALILGTGGASKAVAFALLKLQIPYTFVSRTKSGYNIISYNELTVQVIQNNKLIINTTPIGMYPDISGFPMLPYHALTDEHILYDLVYNPEETQFIKQGKAMQAQTLNGKQMLINQAEMAYAIFQSNGDPAPFFLVHRP
jgi:shikimate dehydrogenase